MEKINSKQPNSGAPTKGATKAHSAKVNADLAIVGPSKDNEDSRAALAGTRGLGQRPTVETPTEGTPLMVTAPGTSGPVGSGDASKGGGLAQTAKRGPGQVSGAGEPNTGTLSRVTQPGPSGPVGCEAATKSGGALSGAAKRSKRKLRKQQAKEEGVSCREPVKRVREASDETVATTRDSKRPKTSVSYKGALTEVKMAIVADGHPSKTLDANMAKVIQATVWDLLVAAPDPLPKLALGKIMSGALHVTCDDRRSADWLKCLNNKVVNDVKIKVIDAKDLPKPVKMAWRTSNTTRSDLPGVIKMLSRLHPALKTDEWKVVDTQSEETHVRRIVYMDVNSADYIKQLGFRLYGGVDVSTFKLLEVMGKKAELIPEDESGDKGSEGPQLEAVVVSGEGSGRALSVSGGDPPSSPATSMMTEDLLDMEGLELESQPSPSVQSLAEDN